MILAFVIKDIILRLNNLVLVIKKTESDWNIKTKLENSLSIVIENETRFKI